MAARNRSHEPAEQRRRAARAQGRCIDCGKPSTGQRCPECLQRVESNTKRYRGQGKRGTVSLVAANMSDMRYAVEALTKAWRGHADVEQLGQIAPRRRDEMLAEPIAQVHLCFRFCREVLVRVGYFASERERSRGQRPRGGSRRRRAQSDERQLAFAW